jgi:hypothetical protein
MAETGQAPENERSASGSTTHYPESVRSFWKRCWGDVESRASVIIGDVVLFLIVLGALMVVSLMLRFVGFFVDYDVRYLKILAGLHFWVYFSVLVAFMLDLLVKIVAMLFVRHKR